MTNKSFKIISTGEIILRRESQKHDFSSEQENKIDEIWKKLKEKKATLFNDKVLTFVNLSRENGKTIVKGDFVDYKAIIANRINPSLNLKLEQIGVSGITLLMEKESVLFSERSNSVTEYPNYLELVPSGNLDISTLDSNGIINYKSKILEEFSEETSLPKNAITDVQSLCFVKDCIDQVYDVCCILETNIGIQKLIHSFKNNSEYKEPELVEISNLKSFVTMNSQRIVPTSLAILEGYLGSKFPI